MQFASLSMYVTDCLLRRNLLEGVHIDMLPPEMYTDITTISSEGMMFLLPCYVHGERADIVICMETKWNIS